MRIDLSYSYIPCAYINVCLFLYLNVYADRLHKCTEVLLAALVNREVCSKSSLMEVWKEDKKCNC